MVHTFTALEHNIALDVESGAVHLLDEIGMAVLRQIREPMPKDCPVEVIDALSSKFAPVDIAETWRELYALCIRGELFSSPAVYQPPGEGFLKALCLHVAHDCDLRCGYCFAGTGRYGGQRGIMSFETARDAIDLLVERSGNRRNLEIDFFGGEPLLALDTVKKTVDYARAHETGWGKNFRFTLTTNGLGLTDESIRFINQEMDNAVLSMDGRRESHDALRKTTAGKGSYDTILPKLQKLVSGRGDRDYFVRGTFTARNPDFVDDLLHMADLGFVHLSMEPVVLPETHPLALREEHMDAVCGAYDRLLTIMRDRQDFTFFHFSVDLTQGPCVYKRTRGCGAGFEYAAVSPEGVLYPCHQFVGQEEYKLGRVGEPDWDSGLSHRFAELTIQKKTDCADCWAKYYCSGGCAASNAHLCGRLDKPYEPSCRLQKKRLECAIALHAERACRLAPSSD